MCGRVKNLLQEAFNVCCPAFIQPKVGSVRVAEPHINEKLMATEKDIHDIRYTITEPGVCQLVHDDVDKSAVARQESGRKEGKTGILLPLLPNG